MRLDGRAQSELRQIRITPNVSEFAEGSALVEFGKTKVLCTASYEDMPPKWLQGSGTGWITAEYGMLPRSTQTRLRRDKSMNSGRTQEISRLIGRSLRAAVDPKKLGECQITVDCDVLHADGGTRTASVTGGFIALALALQKLKAVSEIREIPLTHYIAAVSVGIKNGETFLDLNYDEDSSIHTDMNFVMTHKGSFIEIQGTAEQQAFTRQELNLLVDSAEKGCRELFKKQAEIVGAFFPLPTT